MTDSALHPPRVVTSDEQNLVLLSANPKAGARSGAAPLQQLCKELERSGFELIKISQIDQLAPAIAAAYRTGRLRTVIAAGGDGTAALATNHTPASVPISPLRKSPPMMATTSM